MIGESLENWSLGARTGSRLVGMFCAGGLAAAGIVGLSGCDNLARSRGQFQLVGSFGSDAIGTEGYPLNQDLYVYKVDEKSEVVSTTEKVPLVKVGFRDPWFGELISMNDEKTWSKQSSYMVVDVTNVLRDPTLGAGGDTAAFQRRLKALADLLLVAADANGEVYWRHLTTYLSVHNTVSRTGQVAVGAGSAASFISPVVGASIAGTGLLADTLSREWTEGINVESYAVIREATSLHRNVLRQMVLDAAGAAEPGKASVDLVLRRSYDYAFSYSIQGALAGVQAQKIELQTVLISGESAWAGILARQDIDVLRARVKAGKLTGADKTAAEARLAAWDKAEQDRATHAAAQESAERAHSDQVAEQRRKAALEQERAKAIQAQLDADALQKKLEAETRPASPATPSTTPAPAPTSPSTTPGGG